MNVEGNVKTSSENALIRVLDEQFSHLHECSNALVSNVPGEKLYWQPQKFNGSLPNCSCGEYVLRGAAAVEQTFGGITVNLWDDPFEWTLPESLSTPKQILDYLKEVEATRQRGFQTIDSDCDLQKDIMVPSGEKIALFSLVATTLVNAAQHLGGAYAIFRLFSDKRLPRM